MPHYTPPHLPSQGEAIYRPTGIDILDLYPPVTSSYWFGAPSANTDGIIISAPRRPQDVAAPIMLIPAWLYTLMYFLELTLSQSQNNPPLLSSFPSFMKLHLCLSSSLGKLPFFSFYKAVLQECSGWYQQWWKHTPPTLHSSLSSPETLRFRFPWMPLCLNVLVFIWDVANDVLKENCITTCLASI